MYLFLFFDSSKPVCMAHLEIDLVEPEIHDQGQLLDAPRKPSSLLLFPERVSNMFRVLLTYLIFEIESLSSLCCQSFFNLSEELVWDKVVLFASLWIANWVGAPLSLL